MQVGSRSAMACTTCVSIRLCNSTLGEVAENCAAFVFWRRAPCQIGRQVAEVAKRKLPIVPHTWRRILRRFPFGTHTPEDRLAAGDHLEIWCDRSTIRQ